MIGRLIGWDAFRARKAVSDGGDAPGVIQTAETLAAGDAPFVAEMIAVFVADIDERLKNVSSGIAARDAEVVQMASHAIKGAAGAAGAEGLLHLAMTMERQAAAGELSGAQRTLRLMRALFHATRAALEAAPRGPANQPRA
jgi:HPt (histidine-containing phosphotransfer) domain-containing protein